MKPPRGVIASSDSGGLAERELRSCESLLLIGGAASSLLPWFFAAGKKGGRFAHILRLHGLLSQRQASAANAGAV
jgi:hypothetical protein